MTTSSGRNGIEEALGASPGAQQTGESSELDSFVIFKVEGEGYTLPWAISRCWEELEPHLKRIFSREMFRSGSLSTEPTQDLGAEPTIQYDLIDANGNIVLPEYWNQMVTRGSIFTLRPFERYIEDTSETESMDESDEAGTESQNESESTNSDDRSIHNGDDPSRDQPTQGGPVEQNASGEHQSSAEVSEKPTGERASSRNSSIYSISDTTDTEQSLAEKNETTEAVKAASRPKTPLDKEGNHLAFDKEVEQYAFQSNKVGDATPCPLRRLWEWPPKENHACESGQLQHTDVLYATLREGRKTSIELVESSSSEDAEWRWMHLSQSSETFTSFRKVILNTATRNGLYQITEDLLDRVGQRLSKIDKSDTLVVRTDEFNEGEDFGRLPPSSSIFVKLPYFDTCTIKQDSAQLRKTEHLQQPMALLQVQYPSQDFPDYDRESVQALPKHHEKVSPDTIIQVPQLWAVKIGNKALFTCGKMSMGSLKGSSIFSSQRSEDPILRVISDDGRMYVLPIGQFETLLELLVALQRQLGLEALELDEEMLSRLFATFADLSKPQHIHVKPIKRPSPPMALPTGRLGFCGPQVNNPNLKLDVPPFFCWESDHAQHGTIVKRLQYNSRTTVNRLLQYNISWAGDLDSKFAFDAPSGYQAMRKKTYDTLILTRLLPDSQFGSQLHGVFSTIPQGSPSKLFSKYKSVKQKNLLDLRSQIQTGFEQYIEKLKQFLDLFIPAEQDKGSIKELATKIWGETYYTAKALNKVHETPLPASSQSSMWYVNCGCRTGFTSEPLEVAFRHAQSHKPRASRALGLVTDTTLGALEERLQYCRKAITTCLTSVEQLVISGSYIRYGVAQRDGSKAPQYKLTESFKACFQLVVILVATFQKVMEHIISQYGEGSWRSAPTRERASMEAAVKHLQRIATDANVELRSSCRRWEGATTTMSKWDQSRSIALGPETILAWILRRQAVCDLKGNEPKLPRAVLLYENFMEMLRAKSNRSPQKSLIRDINYLEEELEALNRVRKWQSEIIQSYMTLLDDKTYRYVSGRRRLLFNLEEGILKSVQRQLSKDHNKFQDMLSACQTLARRTQQNADINEETHNKAIYIFTVVTTIFLPLSFVTSFLGMNTVDIRDTEWGQTLFWVVSMPITFVIMLLVLVVVYDGRNLGNISKIFQKPGNIAKRRSTNLLAEPPQDEELNGSSMEAFDVPEFESPFVYTKKPLLTFQAENQEKESAESPANEASGGGLRKSTYVKVHKNHFSIETLSHYGIPWEWDRTDRNYIIILREMDPRETNILLEHTKRLREQASRSYSVSRW